MIAAQAPVRRSPTPDAPFDTEALRGEKVMVYEETEEGWCWGQLCSDGYVGWLPAAAVKLPGPAATHRIAALRTFLYPGRSIKVPPVDALSWGCHVAVAAADATRAVGQGATAGLLTLLACGRYVPTRHLATASSREQDFVAVAERFVGVPYLWGGKGSLGLDCSGLVQVALTATGIACPRDSDLQERAVGADIGRIALAELQRGDLVFWDGHVAIARDNATLLHANAFHMAVAVEAVMEAIPRIAAAGSEITSIRRLVASQ